MSTDAILIKDWVSKNRLPLAKDARAKVGDWGIKSWVEALVSLEMTGDDAKVIFQPKCVDVIPRIEL